MNCPKCAGIMVPEYVEDYWRPFWQGHCLLCGKYSTPQEVEMPRFKCEADKKAWVEKCRRTRALKHTEQEPIELEEEGEAVAHDPGYSRDNRESLERLKAHSWPKFETPGAVLEQIVTDTTTNFIDLAIERIMGELKILQQAKVILARESPIPESTSV